MLSLNSLNNEFVPQILKFHKKSSQTVLRFVKKISVN